jgi:hypothetical protein
LARSTWVKGGLSKMGDSTAKFSGEEHVSFIIAITSFELQDKYTLPSNIDIECGTMA